MVISRKGIVALFKRHAVPLEIYDLQIEALAVIAARVRPTGEPPPCRDEHDRKYLHCAEFGAADYLVTYDRDLLDVSEVGRARILTPAQCLTELRSSGVRLAP